MNIFFSWDWQFNNKLGSPLSSTNILCLKDYLNILRKYEIKGTSKTPISQLFSKLGKIWKCNLGFQKKQFSIFSMNWEKLKSPARATFKNPKISLWIGKNVEVQPKTNTQEIPILNLRMNWKYLCPNLGFTVEDKIGNLHQIGLLTFQTYHNEWYILQTQILELIEELRRICFPGKNKILIT